MSAGTHRKITTFAGEDRNPVFADNDTAFYYLSEESGSFNVHRMSLQGGKAMLWFSNRDGLKSVAQGGSAQQDAYALFFTQDAWDRYRLTKEEYALVKEAEDKKDKGKADASKDKVDAAKDKDVKPEDLVIDMDGLSLRKARLTIHSASLGDAVVSKDGETLYYLARFVVVDTRFNGGGDLVADLAMFVSGKRFFEYTSDRRANGYEPNFRWTKPSISLANEANYSDGHCYAYTVKALSLGKLVGMPTPGTCTFAGWEALPDGIRWGVPHSGVKDSTTGRYLENQQTEPDIKLMNEYAVASKGKDQQLEAAVNALLKDIK